VLIDVSWQNQDIYGHHIEELGFWWRDTAVPQRCDCLYTESTATESVPLSVCPARPVTSLLHDIILIQQQVLMTT